METTLSGRGHAGLLRDLKQGGYRIELNYLWIPSAEFSARRVASRVANGGHGIPLAAIMRRYAKSLRNLLAFYLPLADYAAVWDNSKELPHRVYEQTERDNVVFDDQVWRQIGEYGP
jgi:predicted ABC-type ATPase